MCFLHRCLPSSRGPFNPFVVLPIMAPACFFTKQRRGIRCLEIWLLDNGNVIVVGRFFHRNATAIVDVSDVFPCDEDAANSDSDESDVVVLDDGISSSSTGRSRDALRYCFYFLAFTFLAQNHDGRHHGDEPKKAKMLCLNASQGVCFNESSSAFLGRLCGNRQTLLQNRQTAIRSRSPPDCKADPASNFSGGRFQ